MQCCLRAAPAQHTDREPSGASMMGRRLSRMGSDAAASSNSPAADEPVIHALPEWRDQAAERMQFEKKLLLQRVCTAPPSLTITHPGGWSVLMMEDQQCGNVLVPCGARTNKIYLCIAEQTRHCVRTISCTMYVEYRLFILLGLTISEQLALYQVVCCCTALATL